MLLFQPAFNFFSILEGRKLVIHYRARSKIGRKPEKQLIPKFINKKIQDR